MTVTNLQELQALIQRVKAAQTQFATFTQEQVDRIFKNGIIFSPHPRARNCTIEAARIVLKAAVEAGAPEDIIGWIDQPTVPLSQVEQMAEQAFDDQCTGANPRYPLIQDLKEMYILAYRGCRTDAPLYHQEPALA